MYYDREVWVIRSPWSKESQVSLIWISGTEQDYCEVGETVSPQRRNIRQKILKWLFLPHLLSFHSFVLWDSALTCHFCFHIRLAIHSSKHSLLHVSPSLAMSLPPTYYSYKQGCGRGYGWEKRAPFFYSCRTEFSGSHSVFAGYISSIEYLLSFVWLDICLVT